MADGLRIITDPLDIPDVDESHPFDHSRDPIVEFPKPQIVEPESQDPEPAEPKDIEPVVSQDAPVVATTPKPKAEPKAKAPKKAASGVEMQTLSVRLTIPFYRAVHFHALERKELAQDFAARAVSAQLDREKDREVIYTRTSSRKPRTEEVQMLSASIPESLYQTMKKHVVVHGENVQIFAIRAFTEQIKIESE